MTTALGNQVNDPTDAGTPLRDAPDILGCRWTTSVGTALTVTLTRDAGQEDPEAAVEGWRAGCASPSEVDVVGAVGAACADGAFGAKGTELFARWAGGAMTMRIGLERDAGPAATDVARLEAVARALAASVTPSDVDEATS